MEYTKSAAEMLLKEKFEQLDPKELGYHCDLLFMRKRKSEENSVVEDRVEVWGMLNERKNIFFAALGAFGTRSINLVMLDLGALENGLKQFPA